MVASAAHRVLDTAAGSALHPQLLLEAHEVLGVLDFQADKIDVQVELEVQPPGFKVLLRPQHPNPNHQPAGLAITYQGLRHVNSSGWIFGKELHGTCCCGARITSANPSQFKELVATHIHSSREQASSAAQPASTACPAPSMQAPAGPMDIDGENNLAAQDAADAPTVKQEPGTQPQPTSNGPITSGSHTDNAAAAPSGGPSSSAPPAPQHAGSSNGDMHGAQAGSQPACKELCRGWMSAADDSSLAEELKTLAVMIGAACAGYSELLQPDSVDPATAAAFKAAAEAVLKDSSMRQQMCFLRPVRAPPSHLADAAQRLEQLPLWCRRALQVPFTQWTLAQPWYLHIPASRSHTGLESADMCLPARRLGVNKPSLSSHHAKDGASTGEAGPSATATSSSPSHHSARGQEASLHPTPVAARPPLQHYVGRGRGVGPGGRGGIGVGGPRNMPPISTPPLGMPPLGGGGGGGGGGSGNSNSQQQQQQQQKQQQGQSAATAAGGALREGSSEATRKPTPPAASPAQGGLEALAAARAQGFASLNARAQQQQQQQHQRPSPAKQHPHKQQQGPGGSEHGVQGGGPAAMAPVHPPLPHSHQHQLQHHRRHPGGAHANEHQTLQGQGHLAANHSSHYNNTRPHPPNALPNNAHASAARTEGPRPSLLSGVLEGLPPAEGGDPSLYRTGLTNLPQPSATGRALCARLAKELVEQKVCKPALARGRCVCARPWGNACDLLRVSVGEAE
ncbi:hypothetical protein DUNSADRAFT_6313 [Dunaliella salina]|uniref:Uncharacterized protein n=1 Tax=Dunaliella salina TaxID=3046 RepID=A0ABQ7GNK3_DUNSA|nr:hypothetical protein DUNSADRAFT_6313 [Dunaliella salina]|eukprot:KAF5836161.1 hypothetical protein DUNSADRAFT_6313 [Dunaliella salina]